MHDALRNASFIGFTRTPIELTDRNTRDVFCDAISVYDSVLPCDGDAARRTSEDSATAVGTNIAVQGRRDRCL